MPPSAPEIFENLGISLVLGLLVGLQRQHIASPIAGFRTFPLIALLGTLAATFDTTRGDAFGMAAVGFLALAAIVVVTKAYELRRGEGDPGITTEAAILLIYLVGAYLVHGDRIVAIAVGAGTAVLLQFKPELHGLAARLGDEDLRAIMTFVLITCVVLPVLPNTTYDLAVPLNVLNPFEIWMMVVLMVGITLGSYLLYKFLGRDTGLLLGGLLGGAISSTATTMSHARRTRDSAESEHLSSVIIVIASTVVFARVMLEIAVVAPRHFSALASPIAIMMGSSLLPAGWMWLRVRSSTAQMPPQKNPTELRSALLFAVLYAGVLMGLAAAKLYAGGLGMFAVAAISGLTDLDALTLSTSRLVGLPGETGGITASQGWRLIALAGVSNLCFKWFLCLSLGSWHFAARIGLIFAIPAMTGLLLIGLWPA